MKIIIISATILICFGAPLHAEEQIVNLNTLFGQNKDSLPKLNDEGMIRDWMGFQMAEFWFDSSGLLRNLSLKFGGDLQEEQAIDLIKSAFGIDLKNLTPTRSDGGEVTYELIGGKIKQIRIIVVDGRACFAEISSAK